VYPLWNISEAFEIGATFGGSNAESEVAFTAGVKEHCFQRGYKSESSLE